MDKNRLPLRWLVLGIVGGAVAYLASGQYGPAGGWVAAVITVSTLHRITQ